jgi:citrate lyase beta subunit
VAAYATAIADGSGVTMVNGKMIDAPLALRAERILRRASARIAAGHRGAE